LADPGHSRGPGGHHGMPPVISTFAECTKMRHFGIKIKKKKIYGEGAQSPPRWVLQCGVHLMSSGLLNSLMCTAFLTYYSGGCRQFKMLLHASSQVRDGAITSARYSASSTGYHFVNVSSSRSRDSSSTGRLQVNFKHPRSSPTTAVWCAVTQYMTSRRNLRSADIRTCVVPRTNILFGDRSLTAAGRHIWNSLPGELSLSLDCFKKG